MTDERSHIFLRSIYGTYEKRQRERHAVLHDAEAKGYEEKAGHAMREVELWLTKALASRERARLLREE